MVRDYDDLTTLYIFPINVIKSRRSGKCCVRGIVNIRGMFMWNVICHKSKILIWFRDPRPSACQFL